MHPCFSEVCISIQGYVLVMGESRVCCELFDGVSMHVLLFWHSRLYCQDFKANCILKIVPRPRLVVY